MKYDIKYDIKFMDMKLFTKFAIKKLVADKNKAMNGISVHKLLGLEVPVKATKKETK